MPGLSRKEALATRQRFLLAADTPERKVKEIHKKRRRRYDFKRKKNELRISRDPGRKRRLWNLCEWLLKGKLI